MKMKIYIITFILVALGIQHASAQYAFFPEQGKITYEKTVHVKNLLKRQISTMKEGDFQRKYFEELIVKAPETAVLQRKMTFSGNQTFVEPVETEQPAAVQQLMRFGFLDYGTKIYQDLSKNETEMTFEIAGSPIVIKDSLTNVKWKITDEYRNIAGYDCRRANGVTLDSVYVVAFYTDQIPLSSSPSSLHGLPGMILGLVVPEQHINFYATKVEMTAATVPNLLKKKDSGSTREEIRARMKQIMGQWISDKQFGLMYAGMLL